MTHALYETRQPAPSRSAATRQRRSSGSRPLSKDPSGSVAIEFAVVGPLLLLFLLGISGYGGYFWMSHSLQQLANDAARSAVAGLTQQERQTLAQQTFSSEISSYGMLNPSFATLLYQGSDQEFSISVSYNASSSPYWVAARFLPMPSQTIVRTAAIRLGGF